MHQNVNILVEIGAIASVGMTNTIPCFKWISKISLDVEIQLKYFFLLGLDVESLDPATIISDVFGSICRAFNVAHLFL